MAICHNKKYEREFIKNIHDENHHCERVAGSGSGENSVCDVLVFTAIKHFMVEVKTTKKKKFYVRVKDKKQLEKMISVARKINAIPLLAVKFKQRGWKYFDLNKEWSEFIYENGNEVLIS
jgi:Holliday junction resolvase